MLLSTTFFDQWLLSWNLVVKISSALTACTIHPVTVLYGMGGQSWWKQSGWSGRGRTYFKPC